MLILSKSVNYIFSRFFEAEKVFSQYMEKLFHIIWKLNSIIYEKKVSQYMEIKFQCDENLNSF